MKRFKDCILLCNDGQNPMDLLRLVKTECEKRGMKADVNTSFAEDDTMGVIVNFEKYPAAKLVLHASDDKNGVAILNVVPLPKSGVSMLEKPVYNQILDEFSKTVFKAIAEKNGNEINENTEDYTIEDIIPKSYATLDRWLNAYPLSHHPNDEHRWYDFLIALHKNNEYVSTGVLSDYVREKKHWSDKDILTMEIRYEDQMELLDYYEERR